jgi:hypothetical protein
MALPSRIRGRDVDAWVERTRSEDVEVRRLAVRALCPCHVRADHHTVWDRLLEMTTDPDRRVRSHVVHALTDGSPRDRECEIVAALECMQADPDTLLRRRVRKIMAVYRRTGAWNIG